MIDLGTASKAFGLLPEDNNTYLLGRAGACSGVMGIGACNEVVGAVLKLLALDWFPRSPCNLLICWE